MKWPKSVSPFDVVIIPSITKNNKENLEKAEKIYRELKKQNIDVLLDDVDENMSNKFKKHDLIGIPFQITEMKWLLELLEILVHLKDSFLKQLMLQEFYKFR